MAIGDVLVEGYANFVSSLSGSQSLIFTLLFFTFVITIYGIFVYYFYKNLARKNIVDLNLGQYNTSEHPVFGKFLASIFYIIEYLIILPILTFVWFGVLAIFLLMLSKVENVATILLISAALISAVRVTAHVSENLSRDLAKMLPFTLLALFLVEPNFFSINLFIDRLSQIPSLVSQIPYYLVFIVVLEFLTRIIELIESLVRASRA